MLLHFVSFRQAAVPLGFVASLVIGCGANGGQTGDGSPAKPDETYTGPPDLVSEPDGAGRCLEERRLVSDPDETTELGFSVRQAAEAFELHETPQLLWSQGHSLTPSFEPELSELTLSVTPDVASAVLVDSVDTENGSGDCGPYLELTVAVDIRSTGGALGQQFSTVLRVGALSEASLSYTWKGENFSGEWGAMLGDASGATVELRMELTSSGTSGELTVHLGPSMDRAKVQGEGPWLAAQWSAAL